MSTRGKRFVGLLEKVDREHFYPLDEGIGLLKDTASAKFDESVDAVFRLGIDPKRNENRIRSTVVMPKGLGKTERIAVFAKGEKLKEAEEAGADVAGGDDLVQRVEEGWLEFDRVIATPDMMSSVGKLGRILGPRGLMPSPKSGTVTNEVAEAVREIKLGKVEFRLDDYANIHAPIGRASFDAEALRENLLALTEAILNERPEGVKGKYVRAVTVSTTMGPGVKLDPDALTRLAAER